MRLTALFYFANKRPSRFGFLNAILPKRTGGSIHEQI